MSSLRIKTRASMRATTERLKIAFALNERRDRYRAWVHVLLEHTHIVEALSHTTATALCMVQNAVDLFKVLCAMRWKIMDAAAGEQMRELVGTTILTTLVDEDDSDTLLHEALPLILAYDKDSGRKWSKGVIHGVLRSIDEDDGLSDDVTRPVARLLNDHLDAFTATTSMMRDFLRLAFRTVEDFPTRGVLLEIVYKHKLHHYDWFSLMDGPNHILTWLKDGTTRRDVAFAILVDLLGTPRTHECVVHAPDLVHTLEVLYEREVDPCRGMMQPFVERLFLIGGTTVVLRILSECEHEQDAQTLLRSIVQCPSTTPDVRFRIVALWPRVFHDALGESRQGAGADIKARADAEAECSPTTDHECPITYEACLDPVVASDGHTYERDAILTYLRKRTTSPLTREPLSTYVVPNLALKRLKTKHETQGA